MSLNLRFGLRLMGQAKLIKRYDTALATLERLVPPLPPPPETRLGRIWRRLTTEQKLYHMRRSFIRHPRAYVFKANLSTLLDCGVSTPEGALTLILTLGLWLFVIHGEPFAKEIEAYLARCEFEDISDEIQRRLAKRKVTS